jgi:hypothetical protein
MNKEQIIDEAYENYVRNTPENHVIGSDSDPLKLSMVWKRKNDYSSGYPILERLTQEEFINKCKTDPEFSERWGLKIEERELSLEERIEILIKVEDSIWLNTGLVVGVIEPMLEEHNIPTKLITLTYNNETIENYD